MKFISYLLFISMVTSCAQPKIAMTLENRDGRPVSYMQPWTGGIPGSGSGIDVYFPFAERSVENIEAVYFRDKITYTIEPLTGDEQYVIARFKTDFNKMPDPNMNLDPKKEYGNQSPNINKEKFPFKLKDDEAVVKMTVNGETIYIKIAGIENRSAQDLPSRPQ